MRSQTHLLRRLLGSTLAVSLAVTSAMATAAADQGVARDIDEACSYAPESTFVDRPAGGFGDAVDCVAHYRITSGVNETTYSPATTVDRGQMASFIVRTAEVAGLALAPPDTDQFADDDGTTHEEAINRLAAAGIASGFADDSFRPTTDVTRGQMASFIARALTRFSGAPLPDPTTDFFDDDDGTTHEEAINHLAEIGVVAGTTDKGTFAPNAPVTRTQMALLLARALDWLTETQAVPLARTNVAAATASPELLGAVSATTGPVTTVAFTFDEPVAATTIATDGFTVVGFDGTRTSARLVARDDDTPNVVQATFPSAAARLATTATVARFAVQDPGGNLGPEGAVALQGIELLAGTTSAPDLVSVSRLGAAFVDFSFDEAAFVTEPTGYHLVLADGTVKDSTGVAAGDGTTKHTVSFPLTAAEATEVVRGHVGAAAVSDRAVGDQDGNRNPQQAVAVSTSGALSGIPDLLAITVDAEADQVRYLFDEAVDLASIPGSAPWRVYDLDGSETTAAAAVKVPDDNRAIVVTFAAGTVSSLTSGGSVDAGAVRSIASGGTSRVDEEGLPRSLAGGETAAPDLVRAGRVRQPGPDPLAPSTVARVVFEFDQRLVVRSDTGFSVYDPAGDRTLLTGCTPTGERRLACSADSVTEPALFDAIVGAALSGVQQGAVSDVSRSFVGHADSAVL